ncbi:MAG TPA: desulfoferrodoxin family protein [Bacilli bacterium]
MEEQKFYVCKHCGNLVAMMRESGVRMVCCGEEMELLEANTRDGSREKHVPKVNIEGDLVKVQVGEMIHPMEEKHYIEWIFLATKKGGQFKHLRPGDEPKAEFKVVDDEVLAVYEHCNIHGLYKMQIK